MMPASAPDPESKYSPLLPPTARKILENPEKYKSIKELAVIAGAMQEMAKLTEENHAYLNANAGFEQNVIDSLNNLGTVLDDAILKGKLLDPGVAKAALEKMAKEMKGAVIEGGGFWNAPSFTKEDGWEKRIEVLSASISPMQQQIAAEMRRIMAGNGALLSGLVTPAPAKNKPEAPETDTSVAA